MTSMKILYAEDQTAVVQFVKLLFSEINQTDVIYAKNGKEALELYKNHTFDLVITDMFMPVMDGFELIEEIKKTNPKQVLMMVSGMDNKEDLIRAIELRVNFFLEKPIQVDKFNKIMQEAETLVNRRKEFELSITLLNQYKNLIDTTTIVSKTDNHLCQ